MRQLDRFEQLVFDSQFAVGIFGNPELSDFELMRVTSPGPGHYDRDKLGRMVFVGVMGLCTGVPRSVLAVPLDEAATSALAQAFLSYLEDTANAELVTAFEVAFLARMYESNTRN
jgi:hypothetical protein